MSSRITSCGAVGKNADFLDAPILFLHVLILKST